MQEISDSCSAVNDKNASCVHQRMHFGRFLGIFLEKFESK